MLSAKLVFSIFAPRASTSLVLGKCMQTDGVQGFETAETIMRSKSESSSSHLRHSLTVNSYQISRRPPLIHVPLSSIHVAFFSFL